MLGFFFHLLKAKLVFLGGANIPVIAALLVLGTTGFVVTGTIKGDEDGDDRRRVTFVLTPLESMKCVDALIAQTETLLELDALAADANGQLRRLSGRARMQADEQNKVIDDAALRAQVDKTSGQIRDALATARQQVQAAADLGKCQDRDPNTTVDVNVTTLRATYDGILTGFGRTLTGLLNDAQRVFDQLVATAQPKPKKQEKDDDEEDDDD